MDLKHDLQMRLKGLPLHLEMQVVDATLERIVAEMTVREELSNPSGHLHGGALMAFADTLGALGTIANLPEGKGTTTLESKTNFFAPAPIGTKLIGESTPLHRGRRTQVWETRISTAAGKLVAKVTQTQMVL
jgi:uncharacterized protein (TIGR00369 family)